MPFFINTMDPNFVFQQYSAPPLSDEQVRNFLDATCIERIRSIKWPARFSDLRPSNHLVRLDDQFIILKNRIS